MDVRVQELAIERRARHAERRLEQVEVPDARDPSVAAHLVPMDLQDLTRSTETRTAPARARRPQASAA